MLAHKLQGKAFQNTLTSHGYWPTTKFIEAPEAATEDYDPERCEVWYQGGLSPDFYAWVFPHGKSASIGVGSAHKDFSAKKSVNELRAISGLDTAETIRKEGAPSHETHEAVG